MNVVAPAAGAGGVRSVRVTILSTLGAGYPYLDMSEFAVYTDPPLVTPTPTPTPTDRDARRRTAEPTATATAARRRVAPTPAPSATPAPDPGRRQALLQAAAPPASARSASRARCPKACAVTRDADRRRRDRPQAAHLAHASGTYKRTLKAGATTFTVKVSAKARLHEGHVNQSHVDGAFR